MFNVDTQIKKEEECIDEVLFWKVIHNKYLRNNIIQKIEEINNLKIGCSRKKFKNIKSLKWLIENQQIQLLKCKLKANEYINITVEDLSNLFKQVLYNTEIKEPVDCGINSTPNYFSKKGEYKKGDEYLESDNDNYSKNNNNMNNQVYKKSLKLLLNYKAKELLKFKLIDIIFEQQNYQIKQKQQEQKEKENEIFNKLLFNEPYCNLIKIDCITIESAIIHSSVLILEKLLLNLKNRNLIDRVISEQFKNNIISNIRMNKEFKDEMYQFLINNQLTYNFNIQSLLSPNNNERISTDNLKDFFEIKSSVIQNKLLHLNYIQFQPYHYKFKFNKQVIELLDNNNYQNCEIEGDESSGGGGVGYERIKNLSKIFTAGDIMSYRTYLFKYDEPLNGVCEDDHLLLYYTFYVKSLNALKYLSLKYNENKKFIFSHQQFFDQKMQEISKQFPIEKEKELEYSNDTLEFIKLYTKIYHLFPKMNAFETKLLNFIFSIESINNAQTILESIIRTPENKYFTNLIPKELSRVVDDTISFPTGLKNKLDSSEDGFLIQDTNSLEFIVNEFNYINLYFKHKHSDNGNLFFKFENYQLIDNAKLKFGSNSILFENYPITSGGGINIDNIRSSFYIYPYAVAINNCDIESLKYIDQLLSNSNKNFKFNSFDFYHPPQNIKYSKFINLKIKESNEIKGYLEEDKIKINFINNNNNLTTNNDDNRIKQVLDYFNSSGYKLFSNRLFIKFIKDISKLNSSLISFQDLKFNFQLPQVKSIQLFLESLLSPNLISIFLNNFNPFSSIESSSSSLAILEKMILNWIKTIPNLKDTSFYFKNPWSTNNEYSNHSIWLKYFINYNSPKTNCCYSYESSNDIISCIELILNNNIKTTTAETAEITEITEITESKNKLIYKIIQKIINYLFKRLIKIYNVKIEQIKQIHQFIKSNWLRITNNEFIFEHSQYHSFFYLGIKSNKFMDYILNLDYLSNSELNLNHNLFTFEYIFNNNITNSNDYDNEIFELLKLNTQKISK